MTSSKVTVELERIETDIIDLSTLVDSDEDGWTRLVFSEQYKEGRQFIHQRMSAAGLDVSSDPAGNIVGILPGTNPALPALITGSHTDTVRAGGRFDGVVGVIGAIEVVRALTAAGIKLQRDLYVVDFFGEESNDFGLSCMGSRALVGALGVDDMNRKDATGTPLGERYSAFGLDPGQVVTANWARRTAFHRYVELHIEQGPLLEERHSDIGVVTGIAGIERLFARFSGRADHAGTMPMGDRKDALLAAAEAVLDIHREGCRAPVHGVATTSKVESYPGSPNVVPSEARLAAELRSVDPDWLSSAKGNLARQIGQKAADHGVEVKLDWSHDNQYVPTSDSVQDVIIQAAVKHELKWESIPSGATHDAAHFQQLCPMGMIFVPSKDGRSHCPEEYTAPHHVGAGVSTLLDVILSLDAT